MEKQNTNNTKPEQNAKNRFANWVEFELLSTKTFKYILPIPLLLFYNEQIKRFLTYINERLENHKLLSTFGLAFITIAVLILGIVLTRNRVKRNYKPSNYNTYISSVFLFAYIMIKWNGLDKEFLYLISFNTQTYDVFAFNRWTDLILLLLLPSIFTRIKWHFHNSKPKVNNTALNMNVKTIDYGFTFSVNDKLDRKDELKQLIPLLNESNEEAMTIGINGEWGSGKSFFLKMLIEYLESYNHNIVIKFNPWKAYNELNGMEKELGITLVEELGKYDGELRKNITDYFHAILKTDFSKIEDAVSTIGNLFGEKTILKREKTINDAIVKLNKRIIVVIDDIDRLSSEEVISLIRLVRNTVNFKRIKFILAYDRSYIQNAIEKEIGYNYTQFLEKIINYEHTLRYIHESAVQDRFIELISKNEELSKHEHFINLKIAIRTETNLLESVKNIRQVEQLAGNFLKQYENQKNLNLIDLFYFELIRYKFPLVIKEIYHQQESMLVKDESFKNIKDVIVLPSPNINTYLENEQVRLQILSEVELTVLKKLIASLFNQNRKFKTFERRRITKAMSFNVFFRGQFTDVKLSKEEFTETLKLHYDTIKSALDYWIKIGINDLTGRIYHQDFLEVNDKEELKKRIKLLFYYENKIIKRIESNSGNSYTIFSLMNEKSPLLHKYLKKGQSPFLIEIFEKSSEPYYAELNFLKRLILSSEHTDEDYFGLNYKEAITQATNILNRYSTIVEINAEYFTLHFRKIVDALHYKGVLTSANHVISQIKEKLQSIVFESVITAEAFIELCMKIDRQKNTYYLDDLFWMLFSIGEFEVYAHQKFGEKSGTSEFMKILKNHTKELAAGELVWKFRNNNIPSLNDINE